MALATQTLQQVASRNWRDDAHSTVSRTFREFNPAFFSHAPDRRDATSPRIKAITGGTWRAAVVKSPAATWIPNSTTLAVWALAKHAHDPSTPRRRCCLPQQSGRWQ